LAALLDVVRRMIETSELAARVQAIKSAHQPPK
jgi:hypothetical protein